MSYQERCDRTAKEHREVESQKRTKTTKLQGLLTVLDISTVMVMGHISEDYSSCLTAKNIQEECDHIVSMSPSFTTKSYLDIVLIT